MKISLSIVSRFPESESSCQRDERGAGISMGYSRGTAKTVPSQPDIKAGDIEAINTSPVDESAAFVYLDGRRKEKPALC